MPRLSRFGRSSRSARRSALVLAGCGWLALSLLVVGCRQGTGERCETTGDCIDGDTCSVMGGQSQSGVCLGPNSSFGGLGGETGTGGDTGVGGAGGDTGAGGAVTGTGGDTGGTDAAADVGPVDDGAAALDSPVTLDGADDLGLDDAGSD
jgi:hypothetical protein